MNEFEVLKTETYKKLKSLNKQYLSLPSRDLICKGAESVWKLQICILERLIDRFDGFSEKQLRHVNQLFHFFENICGYLSDSITKNVPWSVVPSLEELFAKIKSNTDFVICPLWKTNYKIITRNVIEIIDIYVLSAPDLLFDYDDEFDINQDKFLEGYPNGIYFIFYPRSERLSVLHLPLFGHEIGHIFSSSWLEL